MTARQKYGIDYPTLYAVAGTVRNYGPPKPTTTKKDGATPAPALAEVISNEEAFAFNSVQRGHQNSVENYPVIIALALGAWGFPIASGFAMLSWALGRTQYFTGYSQEPGKRNNLLAALLTYPALFALAGLNLASAILFFRGTIAYTY